MFRVLRSRADFLTARQIADLAVAGRGVADTAVADTAVAGRGVAGLTGDAGLSLAAVLGRLRHLGRDFELEIADSGDGPAYRLGRFKAFLGQREHDRYERFAAARATIS